ncbi:hypothetical protein ACGFMK_00650 [Amycolatopsis sp. NPDC049252]|uniref:hypothetical protein n=1 Tax=Amycolatopsis sp. NPDC049252 TaxID=3363933 RepID=UPI00371C2653
MIDFMAGEFPHGSGPLFPDVPAPDSVRFSGPGSVPAAAEAWIGLSSERDVQL